MSPVHIIKYFSDPFFNNKVYNGVINRPTSFLPGFLAWPFSPDSFAMRYCHRTQSWSMISTSSSIECYFETQPTTLLSLSQEIQCPTFLYQVEAKSNRTLRMITRCKELGLLNDILNQILSIIINDTFMKERQKTSTHRYTYIHSFCLLTTWLGRLLVLAMS